MNIKDKKMAVFHQLNQESEPIGLSKLVNKLGDEYSERSVRRWLSEMITEELVEKIGQKKSTKYQIKRASRENNNKGASFFGAVIAIYELQKVRPLLDLYLFSYMRTCAMYDSTVKAMGFDEVRVRYRQQRRDIIRHIILNQLSGTPMHDYISSQNTKFIKKEDQALFFEDVMEDLKEIDLSRIAGLGITPEQLNAWKKA